MKRRYSPYNKPPWVRNLMNMCKPFIIPICIFQAIRTFFFPTTFDVLLLLVLVCIAASIRFNIF
ncbi:MULTISPECIES: hypothetical protein [Bacillus]|uniref:hypothetical protein n=1 Tax=Bacillus TaxID=1386 RepID=UPI0009D99680|nr:MULTISPECIES: hypothetical protein [Bacillus]